MSHNLRAKYLRSQTFSLPDLLEIMAALRNPETGCPWDIEQTFQTIAPYTIEEAYEVADAIAQDDMSGLKEELGDLLLQAVYHAQMASERGEFSFSDIVDAISRKMIRRHPHVFGSDEERARGVRPGFWERIKSEEKEENGAPSGRTAKGGVLDEVPVALPALTRAVKLQKAAARVGFDWPDIRPVQEKFQEEWEELSEAVDALANVSGRTPEVDQDLRRHIEEEFGDVLFVLANLARHLRINPEQAGRKACDKFGRRFGKLEKKLEARGRDWDDMDLAGLDRIWDEVKDEE